ncbi:HU family DNA-binding protein [Paramagnetospirillum marisnigri]|uniref:HU family DNA-binding protein n=1 Tax=Paramagnetospirillum marisnigri TaxID=1285242 RepID=UPI000B0F77AB|nr:HU family DNA-binding protein [Paramagnetospirillum marisnigri]
MNKQDLIDDVAATIGSTKAEAGKAVDAAFDAIRPFFFVCDFVSPLCHQYCW